MDPHSGHETSVGGIERRETLAPASRNDPASELPPCLPRHRITEPYNGWSPPRLGRDPTLALCETPAEVSALARDRGPGLDAVVALTPEAAFACRVRGTGYLKLEDFYDVEAFLAADEPMLRLQASWADAVDSFAWEALPDLAELGVRPAGHCFFPLKGLIDRLYQASFALAHLLLASSPARILHYAAPAREPVPDTLSFGGSLHARVLTHMAPLYGAEAVALAPVRDRPRFQFREPGPRYALRALIRERLLSARNAMRELWPSPAWARGRGEIVYQEYTYDLAPLVDRLSERGFRTPRLNTALLGGPMAGRREAAAMRQSLGEIRPDLEGSRSFGEVFRWAGLDLAPIAESRIAHWWLDLVPSVCRAAVTAGSRFARRRPAALLLYSPVTPRDQGTLQAARRLGIPTITYQHGGFEGSCEYTTNDMTDLRLADHRLTYGEGVTAYLRERTARWTEPRARPWTVGSARLDALRAAGHDPRGVRRRLALEEGRPTVLYLPAGYQPNWYLSRTAYLSVPYFELLAEVAAVFERFAETQFVYKPFPGRADPVVEIMARSTNVSVVRDLPVPALLPACDAFVIDVPSTALLEAMLTTKPILAHADRRFIALRPGARDLLRRRAELTETPAELLAGLERFVGMAETIELRAPDNEFLRSYGTHLDDGRSTERAAGAVAEIIASGCPGAVERPPADFA